MSDRAYYAHLTACIDEPCTIGVGTQIRHFSYVMQDAIIGARCALGQNVFVASRVHLCKLKITPPSSSG